VSIFSKARGSRARLIIALFLTLLAGVSVYYYLVSVHDVVPVVVATKDINPNTVIEEGDVRIANVSADGKHQLAFNNPEQIIGSTTKETVYKDMQLISSQLAEKDSGSLKPGETLLPLSNVVASPGLKTGNPVDITVVRQEGAFPIEGARIYQVKNEEVVIVIDKSKVQQVIGTIADAQSIYFLVAGM
jgi:hypothetical protein